MSHTRNKKWLFLFAIVVVAGSVCANEVGAGESPEPLTEAQLVARIDQLAKRLPPSDDYLDYAQQRAERQKRVIQDVGTLLERFPKTNARSRMTRLRLECLFYIALHEDKPLEAFEAEVDRVLREVKALPDPALEADAAAWKIRCVVSRLQRDGRPAAEVRKAQLKWSADYVARFPKSPFSPRMLEVLIKDAWARKDAVAKNYIQTLKACFPNHVITDAITGTLWRRAAINQPLELSIKTLDGQTIDTKTLRGKVVLIQFWATFSPASIQHVNALRASYAAHHAAGLEIIGVNLDADRGELDQAVAEHQIAWPQSHDGLGWAGPIVKKLAVRDLPTTLLIDRDTILRRFDAQRDLQAALAPYFP